MTYEEYVAKRENLADDYELTKDMSPEELAQYRRNKKIQ